MRFFAVYFLKSVFAFFLIIAPIASAQNSLVFDNGADIDYSFWSNSVNEQRTFGRFELEDNYQIEDVTWRGLYFSGDPSDPLVDDNFTIQIYGDHDILPLAESYTSDNVGVVSRVATGETLSIQGDRYDVYQYSASITPFALRESTNYWLSISNESAAPWSWAVDIGSSALWIRTPESESGYPAATDFSLFGSSMDLPADTTSKWTSADGFFDNPDNWNTEFTPANVGDDVEWNAVIDRQTSAPFQIQLRTDAQLESLTLDSVNASLLVGNENLSVGSLTVNNGLFRVGSPEDSGPFTNDKGEVIVSTSFENHGRVEIVEQGALRLIFDSQFVQNEGSLFFDNGAIHNEGEKSMLFLDGSLEGGGTIFSDVDFGGTLRSGAATPTSTNQIFAVGDWTFLQTAESEIQVGGPRAIDSGALLVQGDLFLDGILAIEMIDGFELIDPEDEIAIMLGSTISGEFLNVVNGGLLTSADGRSSFTVHYGSDSIFDSNLVVLSNFTSVPEPSVLIGGWLVLAVSGSRRRRS